MNLNQWSVYLRQLAVLLAACASIAWMHAHAATTDISATPLGTRSGANVPPNMMFILDDSGSMARDFLPDQIDDSICKACDSGSCDMQGRSCRIGIPPFNAYQVNTLFYNPNVRYNPGVNYLNASLGNATPTAARNNPYDASDTSTTNIAANSTDQFWCTTASPSAAQLANTAVCRRNGTNTGNPFNYTTTAGLPNTTFFNRVQSSTVAPHYYNVTPREHCTDESLITCTLSATPTTVLGVQYNFPANLRWCRTTAAADSATAVSGNNVSGSGARDCQALVDGTYQYARYGSFSRVDILTGNTYPKSTGRTDCAGAVGATGCTYTEELQNYANWHAYYRTRILTMKTVPGRVFASIGNDPNAGDIRVGFLTINALDSSRYLKISDFKNNTHRQNWFNTFYGITTSSSTPLRQALSRVGRHYAGVTTGINSFMTDEPMTASCQRNYALLTTDGYWNGSGGQTLTGTAMGNTDSVSDVSAPIYVDRATTGTLDAKGTSVTTVTPFTETEQAKCVGAGNATFSGPATRACGCTGIQTRIIQRVRTYNTTLVQVDGAAGTPTTGTFTDTYSNITACTTPLQVTTVTPVTVVDEQVLTGNATSTFAAINGVAAGANQAGVCTGNQRRVKRRTTTFNSTVITTDGVAAAPTVSGTTYTFSDPGTCASVVTTDVTPVTRVEEQVLTGNATSTFAAINGVAAGANQAGVCTGGQRRVKRRTTTFNSTVITTDGVAAAATFSGTTYAFSDPGTCTSVITTAVTPITVVEEQLLTANAASTFGPINGLNSNQAGVCTGGQRRIKRRTTTYNSTVITTDGVAGAATLSGTTFAFSDPGVCTSQVSNGDTTVTVVEQQLVNGTNNSTFAAINGVATGANQAGVCSGSQGRIKQRTTTYTSRVVTTDGVAAPAVVVAGTTGYAFSNPGACVSVTNTVVTRFTVTEQQAAFGGVATTFAAINGITSNQNGSCSANFANIKQKMTTYDQTVVTTDGVPGAPTFSNQSSVFSDIGACQAATRTQVNPVTETNQFLTPVNSSGTTAFVTPQNSGTSGNPQTGYTCTGSGANRTQVNQRVLTYNRTRVTVGSGATTTTFGATTSGPTFSIAIACANSVKTATGQTLSNGANTSDVTTAPPAVTGAVAATTNTSAPISNTTSGSYPTPAATSTSNGSTTNTTVSSYPTAAVTTTTNGAVISNTVGVYPTAAATTTTNGTTASTTAGAYPTAAATSTTNGGATVLTNSGTNLAITLSPNPGISQGAASVTTTAGGSGDTLADVAMYYYKTDLRTTGSFSKNNVPVSGKYVAPHQHMVTFTLGLGLDGQMTYRDDYETATTGDFFKIKSGATTCIWTTGTCNWPTPAADTATAIDDLWHAAVNGRGKYFSAKVPGAVEAGVKETLAAINVATGSAAAAATSTPNLTTTNNTLYSSTYRTVNWDGELVARTLDPATGQLQSGIKWSAATQLNGKSTAASDTRTIYTFDGTNAATKRKSFTYANLTATEKSYFDNKCTVANWNQCTVMLSDATRLAAANSGDNLVNYLRGHRGNELALDLSTGLFRRREFLLGDTVNSKPAFMGPPELQFADAVSPSYSDFKNANFNRTNTLFVAANDGMLHAFNGDTGAEMWAYIPKQILPDLFTLANDSYDNAHRYFVDGSPVVGEAYLSGAWKSVLVGGFNSGGRGYYAMDVTDPANPKGMWEICADSALCAISDVDMGLTYGPAIIGKMPAGGPNAGKWVAVVTSGYNNVGGVGGNGGGYLYVLDLATGAVLHKVGTTISGTNVGDTTTPSGLARISAYVTNFVVDNTISLIYGGDLLGNMWRFDMAGASGPTVKRIAQLKDGSATPKPQSITTAPEITRFDAGFNTIYVGTGRFIGTSDIGDPATQSPALPFSYQQSIYAFKDTDADLGNLRAAGANLVKQTLGVVDAATRSVSNNVVDWTVKNGWYIDLNPVCVATGCAAAGESPGERVNIDMQLVRGTLVVISNEPNAEECSTGGDSFIYQFRYDNGSYIVATPGGVAGTKIGNSLSVGIVVFQTTTGQIKSVITTADGKLPEQPINTAGGTGSTRRAAWRELLDNRDASGNLQ